MPLPPSLDALQPTWAEYSVCAKAQVAVLLALNGRNMRQIKSHALVYFNEKPAVECLPRDLGPEDYFVVFAKLTDSEVVTAKKNRLLVRRVVTDALLKIYRDNIDVYFQKLPSSKTVCTPPPIRSRRTHIHTLERKTTRSTTQLTTQRRGVTHVQA